jgi:hypothetical protein
MACSLVREVELRAYSRSEESRLKQIRRICLQSTLEV